MTNNQSTLPQDIEVEQAILGSILVSGKYSQQLLDELADKLKIDYFFDINHQQIYRCMLELWTEQIPVDIVTVIQQIKRTTNSGNKNEINQNYLTTLIAKSSLASSPNHIARILKEKYLLRTVIGLGEEIKNLAFNDQYEAATILDLAQKKLYEASIDNIEKNFVRIGEILSGSFDRLEAMQQLEGGTRGTSTGFTDLDGILGGFQNSDLIILAARPSMGKTALALEITKRIALKQTGVAFFSLEMSVEQLCDRLIASTSGVDFGRIRHGNLSADEKNRDFEKIGEAISKLGDSPIWIDDSGSLNILELRSKVRRLKNRQNLGLVVIDYLQLMSGRSERSYQGNRVQEISDITRNLKILARELNLPIIALSQLSRGVESRDDKKPLLSDLRESGSIEQDADIVMFVHREEMYKKDLPDNKKGKADILISKHRNGETGTVELAWVKHLATFDSLYEAKISHKVEK